jgi:pimeloyl-ACP methyl ester carboxylesterase
VLWGREDPLLPVAVAYELHELIQNSRLEIWEGIGHCPMMEDPGRFNDCVAAFVTDEWHGWRQA